MLAAYIPKLKVYGRVWRWEGERDGVLANGRDGVGVWVGGCVESFYLREKGGFAGVVEAEEENGVFWAMLVGGEIYETIAWGEGDLLCWLRVDR